MPFPSGTTGYDPWVVALSYLIASFASYVALDLATRMRTADRALALGWWIAGSFALGTGIWSMHFVGMLALKLPFLAGYGYVVTALSWVAAVGVSAVALYIASFKQLTARALGAGAMVMGAGICAMHYTGMAALELQPGITWNPLLVAASAAIAVGASGAALLIFFGLRRLSARRARPGQFAAALVMGAAIGGMHYTGMAAAAFPAGAVCLSAGQLGGDKLGLMVAVASLVLLTMTMFTLAVDAHMQGKAARLAASLQTANAQLQQIAFRDALTQLPNRLLFDDRLGVAVQQARRDDRSLAVLFIDLDAFKPVNDSFGHAVGDHVLREIARRLAERVREGDTVARVGGDEFVMLLQGNPTSAAVAALAQRLIDACTEPVFSGAHELRLSCSVGIAMFPADGPGEQLMKHADAAMYAAKRAGGGAYAFFEPHMNAGMREQAELQRDLRHAIENGGLLLHYQPKVQADSGVITGVEALVRWQHPQRGLLAPGEFIGVAERFGLIGALGDWVISEACRQIVQWRDEGLRVRVAINLSVHQLRQDDLGARVQALAERHGIDPSLLVFEITESVAMDDTEATQRLVRHLHGLGITLAIDDFGTGYSSLAYLRQLRVGQLKVDRSFVQDLETSSDARAIVEAVIRLAHALGLRVVAEGVESQAQREVLQALHCDELQGWHFSRAIPPQLLTQWALGHQRPQAVAFAESAYLDPA